MSGGCGIGPGLCSSAPPGRVCLKGIVFHGLRCAPPRGYSPRPLRGLEDHRAPVGAIGAGWLPSFWGDRVCADETENGESATAGETFRR